MLIFTGFKDIVFPREKKLPFVKHIYSYIFIQFGDTIRPRLGNYPTALKGQPHGLGGLGSQNKKNLGNFG